MKSIDITQGKVVWVDDFAWEEVARFSWVAARAKHTWYAYRKEGKKTVWMHREIMQAPAGMEVDHRDGNGLHNYRGNLRLATHAENAQGRQTLRAGKTSKYRGVRFHFPSKKWTAQIKRNGHNWWLGSYDKEDEAAHAYDDAARRFFGCFAQFNLAKF